MKLLLRGFFMATSLTPVTIPAKTWTDVYDAAGISVGTQLIIQNIGRDQARLSESVASPTSTTGYNVILTNEFLTSAATPVGAWSYSTLGTKLQIEEA